MENEFWQKAFNSSFTYYIIKDANGKKLESNLPNDKDYSSDECISIINNEFYAYNEQIIQASNSFYILKTFKKIPENMLPLFLIDEKTGAYSNVAFKLLLKKYLAAKHQVVLSVIDIDDFKNINDTYGHVFGDQVLLSIAKLIKHNIKDQDMLCRFGGDEFILCFIDIDTYKALLRVNDIIKRIAKGLTFNDTIIRPTISIGITAYDPKRTYESNLKIADSALYQSKTNGKNQATVLKRVRKLPPKED
jgi:diguanylate cyclase (GGDEF)-like protein